MAPPMVLGIMVAAGTVMSAIQNVQQGNAAASAGRYNAQIAKQKADGAIAQSRQDAETFRKQSLLKLGALRANAGAGGNMGGALDMLEAAASEAELGRQNILYKGQLRAVGYTNDAQLDEFSADNAEMGGYRGAASAILLGGAKSAAMFNGAPSTKTETTTPDLADWEPER